MQKWGIPLLRISLGIVFLWFGSLKLIGASPVNELIAITYSFLPQMDFIILLGILECVIGLGLISKINLRLILFVLWIQMAGTLIAPILSPSLFFQNNNIFLLTMNGEFVVKNLVLVFASMVIGGFEVKPKAIVTDSPLSP
jgi:uncharacterized membrane protein YkgB